MSSSNLPEPWLRGPVPGVPALLQPAAHALLLAREEVEAAAAGLFELELWVSPGGAASPAVRSRCLTYSVRCRGSGPPGPSSPRKCTLKRGAPPSARVRNDARVDGAKAVDGS